MVGLIKYKRVAARLREKFQDDEFTIKDLEDVIFIECGTDPRTVKSAIDRMIRLDLIKETEQVRVFGVMPTRKFKLTQAQNDLF